MNVFDRVRVIHEMGSHKLLIRDTNGYGFGGMGLANIESWLSHEL